MNQKYKNILLYLAEQTSPVTSNQIAQELSVSSRSVKSYVTAINHQFGNVIQSSRNGYYADSNKIKSLLYKEKNDYLNALPQNYEERSRYIIKRLMEDNSLYIEDLSDEIYVSTQTLINDIKKMNTQFNRYKCRFEFNKGELTLLGKENSKRKLMSRIIRDEADNAGFDINFLNYQFVNYDVQQISRDIKKIFKQNGVYLNEFNYENLILHILIILSRNDYDEENIVVDVSEHIKKLTEEVIAMIEENYDMVIGENSKTQLEVLLSCHSINPETIFDNSLQEEEQIGEFVEEMLKKIKDDYGLELNSDIFKYPFILHMINLNHRLKSDTHVDNSLGDSIRRNCPTIYEIAVNVAFDIKNEWGKELDEGEISFIALHIGGEIQRQQQDEAKQPVALVIKDYHGLREWLYNQTMINFGNRIRISGFYDKFADVPNNNMVILTLENKINTQLYPNAVTVNAFTSLPNLEIVEVLDKVDNYNKLKVLYDSFNGIFKEDLFLLSAETDYKKVIWKMTKQLLNEAYVNDDFYHYVLEREEAGSTAFGRIAIPHSIKFDGLTTAICVLINPAGIDWNGNKVNIVFLVSVNKADSTYFRSIIGALIQLFEEDKIMDKMIKCQSFAEFKKIIYDNKII